MLKTNWSPKSLGQLLLMSLKYLIRIPISVRMVNRQDLSHRRFPKLSRWRQRLKTISSKILSEIL